MVLNEEHIANLLYEEIKKSDIIDTIRHDKDFERRVKEIVEKCLCGLFKVLYQHNNIFKNLA